MPVSEIEAGRYRQPAYVTNAYFTNSLISDSHRPKPDYILNVIRAGYPDTRGYMVLELIVDKGTHRVSIELLDGSGNVFEEHKFPVATADKDDFIISLNLRYGGDLPSGGIFFKLHDRFQNKKKAVISTFRILSDQW